MSTQCRHNVCCSKLSQPSGTLHDSHLWCACITLSICTCYDIQEGDNAVADWWKRSPEQWQAGELLLACGAAAVADLRAAVAAELGYSCSAGVAHNKA